jgi:glucoamylase
MSDGAAYTPEYLWLEQHGEAPGAPGLAGRWTSSVKNSVGTAYSASSKVWYTTSHGILNELYYPTIDRPQIRDMEFLVTDGETFFHEEKRDMVREFAYIDPASPAVRHTNSDPGGRYRLIKETISDPHAPVVLVRVRLEAEAALLPRLHLYALLSPHLGGGGAGNSARVLDVSGSRVILAWHDEISLAMATSCGFSRASCGFVGTSDGWQDLRHDFRMDWEYGSAHDGNIAIMGEVDLHRAVAVDANTREFVLAIGFGESNHAALSASMSSLAIAFDGHLQRFIRQWERVQLPGDLQLYTGDNGRLLRISQKVVLMHEDKTYAGAFIASMSIPWGYAKGDDDLGGYHLVWTRDMVQSASALLAAGRTETALRALVYLACTQKPDGSFAQNFWVNGTPYWTGIQLDEVAFPIILAWRLWKANGLANFDVFAFVSRAAGFLVRYAPVTQQERWEENAGYSPSTLAAVIGGLCCAGEIAKAHGSPELGVFLEEHADWLQSHLEDWCVTNDGVLHPDIKRHYIRIQPPGPGESWYRNDVAPGNIRLNNRAPWEESEFPANSIIDAGFLELVRYGVRRADDPLIVDSLKVVDRVLRVEAPQGPCWRRYNRDGYGEQEGGGPFISYGQGRAWPLLTGERGHYELAAGNDVRPFITAMEGFASKGGMLPEQIWDRHQSLQTSAGPVVLGDAAGSAMPLVWAHAEYIKLVRSAHDKRVFDRIEAVAARYGEGPRPSVLEIWKLRRQIASIVAGKVLRIIAAQPFEVLYTTDNWLTQRTVQAQNLGTAGSAADILTDVQLDARGLTVQREAPPSEVSFTLYWLAQKRWEGRNFSVKIEAAPAPANQTSN